MFSIPFEKYSLSNGLDVILQEDHSLPTVAVNVWYHVGSKDEEPGRTGFAHLFEHVMFEGSKHHNRNYFEPLQKAGGELNGSTALDRTNYWENVPSNYLELALWLESDRMGFLLDALDQKRFDIQRDVVKNERRQSYENRPYGSSYLLLQPALFPPPHPYNWPTIGSQEDLDAASLDDVKGFFSRFYGPSNASLAIAGDFDPNQAKSWIEDYFGDIPPVPPVTRIGRMASSLTREVEIVLRDKVQLPRLYLVWPSVPLLDEAEAPLDILGAVLGSGKSSRLYRSLVYDKQIASDVSVSNYSEEIAGEFGIQITASPGHTLKEIQDVVETEIRRIRQEPPSEREVARAKNRLESQVTRQLERVGGFGGRADQLNHYNVMAGDPGLVNTDLRRYLDVGSEDILRAARDVLGENRVHLSVLPEEQMSASASVVDRTVMPGAAKAGTFSPAVPRRHRLANGLNVLHVGRSGVPLVAIGLVVDAGAVTDASERPGVAHLTASMLTEGTSTRSSQQIAEELEFLGARIESTAGREHVVISTETLTTHWETAMAIVSDLVKNATFPENELERVRKERVADLSRISDYATAIAGRAARALVYGPDSAYGRPITGTEASVSEITHGEIVAQFERRYGPQNATLLVVGDVTEEEVLSRVGALLGDWQPGKAEPRSIASGDSQATPATIYLADKPGAPQSVIRAGHMTVPRGDADYYALTMLNYVFGGQPTARLFMNWRQDKGYSYGYYSSIDWLTGPSALFAGGSVETGVTKESVIETLSEFAGIRGERPVSTEEFQAAKDGILQGFPGLFETNGQILQQLSNIAVFGLPDDYYSHVVANMEAVTLSETHRVARERVDDEHLAVLVVGDREAVEPGLAEVGLPIVHVDYEGRRLSGG